MKAEVGVLGIPHQALKFLAGDMDQIGVVAGLKVDLFTTHQAVVQNCFITIGLANGGNCTDFTVVKQLVEFGFRSQFHVPAKVALQRG